MVLQLIIQSYSERRAAKLNKILNQSSQAATKSDSQDKPESEQVEQKTSDNQLEDSSKADQDQKDDGNNTNTDQQVTQASNAAESQAADPSEEFLSQKKVYRRVYKKRVAQAMTSVVKDVDGLYQAD